jgi:hypothetical protein
MLKAVTDETLATLLREHRAVARHLGREAARRRGPTGDLLGERAAHHRGIADRVGAEIDRRAAIQSAMGADGNTCDAVMAGVR